MNIRKTSTLTAALALTALTLTGTPANARTTREFLGSFGPIKEMTAVAVDLETGNVYVTSDQRFHPYVIYVFGPDGGTPNNGVPSEITGPSFGGEAAGYPWGIAVDNSCYEHQPRLSGKECEEYDPSYGDVYAMSQNIQKFRLNPGHGYELVSEGPYVGGDRGLAIDSRGNLYVVNNNFSPPGPVTEYKKIIDKVTNGKGEEEIKEELKEITIPQTDVCIAAYIAVDDSHHVYVGSEKEGEVRESRGVAKLTLGEAGNVLSDAVLAGVVSAHFRPVAVNSTTGTVYVGNNSEIDEFDSAGALQLTFGSAEEFGGSLGNNSAGVKAIAVNGENDRIYVVNPAREDVDVFGVVVKPAVVEGVQPSVSGVSRTSALVGGTANPESGRATYYFQYVPEGEYAPGAAEPYVNGGASAVQSMVGGHVPETVERVALTGLRPGTIYHYRMAVVNGTGTTYGPDETFTTAPATPPGVVTRAAVEVSATSVTLTGTVAPKGLPSSYVFEVGTDTGYGGARLFGNAGSSTGEVAVSVGVQFLVPGTTYHFRLAATSFDGTSYGQDGTFTTPGVPSTVVQPVSESLVASPSVVFPSIAGAITKLAGHGKARGRRLSGAQKRRRAALRVCRRDRSGKRRVECEARAHRAH